MRKSRLEKPSGHCYRRCRHRSRSVSPGSLKKRKNARLHSLKELENRVKYVWNLHGDTIPGFKGGGRKSAEILDYERLARIIVRISVSKETSKKEFWKAVAQNYYRMFNVDKKKVERLRLLLRRNGGDIKSRVKKCPASGPCGSHFVHQREDPELLNSHSEENDNESMSATSSNKNEYVDDQDVQISHDSGNNNYERENSSMSHDGSIDDFFGRVLGRAVITVYNEICCDYQYQKPPSAAKTQDQTPLNFSNVDVGVTQCHETSTNPIQSHVLQSPKQHVIQTEKSSNHVCHVDNIEESSSLTCYDQLDEDPADNAFLINSNMLSKTAKTLSGSNIPSSGQWRSQRAKCGHAIEVVAERRRREPSREVWGRAPPENF